jgi:hypothetical protein
MDMWNVANLKVTFRGLRLTLHEGDDLKFLYELRSFDELASGATTGSQLAVI